MAKTPQLTKQEDFVAQQPNFAKIGDVVQSTLTEVQFQTERDGTWVLMDGRDVTGSDFATLTGLTTLPDARGQFLRGLDTSGTVDPDGAGRVLGDSQVDKLQGHRHEMWVDNDLGAGALNGGQRLHRADAPRTGASGTGDYIRALTPDGVNGTPRTGLETRPKNIAVNIFIKINREPSS